MGFFYVRESDYDETASPEDLREFEVTEDEIESEFRDMLDEIFESFRFGSLTYCPSRVLSEIDPVAYRCELADFEAANFVEVWEGQS